MSTKGLMLDLYEKMVRSLLWEQHLLRLVDEGLTDGIYHAGRGQEGAQVGAVAALGPQDYLYYAHRGCGYMVARGMPMDKIYGDFMANDAGSTGGMGAGIVHVAWPELGILGQSGTVGGSFPLAVGTALSAQLRGTDQVCLCFFGDGTANRGTFHEAANAASVWKAPVIWLCENNGYAISSKQSDTTSVEDIADRAAGYGMPGVVVDGQDAMAVYQATSEAVARARAGEGPTLIEAKTIRFRGHHEGDPDGYRDRQELDRLRRDRDPIKLLEARMLGEGESQATLDEVQERVQTDVRAAAELAKKGSLPSVDYLFDVLYSK